MRGSSLPCTCSHDWCCLFRNKCAWKSEYSKDKIADYHLLLNKIQTPSACSFLKLGAIALSSRGDLACTSSKLKKAKTPEASKAAQEATTKHGKKQQKQQKQKAGKRQKQQRKTKNDFPAKKWFPKKVLQLKMIAFTPVRKWNFLCCLLRTTIVYRMQSTNLHIYNIHDILYIILWLKYYVCMQHIATHATPCFWHWQEIIAKLLLDCHRTWIRSNWGFNRESRNRRIDFDQRRSTHFQSDKAILLRNGTRKIACVQQCSKTVRAFLQSKAQVRVDALERVMTTPNIDCTKACHQKHKLQYCNVYRCMYI